MKRKFFCICFSVIVLTSIFTETVFAATQIVEKTPSYTDDTVVSISFEDGQLPPAEYIYTGKKIKPAVIVKKVDKTVAKSSEYKITYDDDCEKVGLHSITVEYLKSGYKVSMDYLVVPGTTQKVDMTAKNGNVTLSWASVQGATCYRVYQYSGGKYVEIPWEDGSIAAPKLSRTFTNLEPGETYNMAIMALEKVSSMPTKYMRSFKFTVPNSGNGSLNIVPGINETTPVTTTKQSTTQSPLTEVAVTPATEEGLTKAVETTQGTTVEKTTVTETEIKSTTAETTEKKTMVDTQDKNFDVWKLVPIFAVIAVVIIVAGVFILIKKKKK